MDRRQQHRAFVDLPVQIWGMDAHSRPFTQPASVRTISGRGATLQCVDARLKPGDMVDVFTNRRKVSFVSSGAASQEPKWKARWASKMSPQNRLWDIDPFAVRPALARDKRALRAAKSIGKTPAPPCSA